MNKTMKLPVYLDYMATCPTDPRVAKKMQDYLTQEGVFGNSMSHHSYGEEANLAVEKARAQLGTLIGATAQDIIWTSGATESNNLAIKGAVEFYHRKGKHIITVATEHKSVLYTCKYLAKKGYEVTFLPVDELGFIDLNQLEEAMRPDTVLVSIMHVNNEIGVIQDIAEIGKLTRAKGILFHIDAAQSLGKVPFDVEACQADLVSFSGHKMYSPKGIGALYLRSEPQVKLASQLHGAGHEHGLRAGTLPVQLIVALGFACEIAQRELTEEVERLTHLRNKLWDNIKQLPGIILNGDLKARVCNNLCVSFSNVHGEALMMGLKDIAVSAGSACMSAQADPSHVLLALGRKPHIASNSLRLSLGRYTTEEEIDYVINLFNDKVSKLTAISPMTQK